LQLSHAFLRVNITDERYLGEAQTIFEHSMKQLLSKNGAGGGKVLQTKTFVQRNPETGRNTAQIRCYFAFNPESSGSIHTT
jgi:hypothetical protein